MKLNKLETHDRLLHFKKDQNDTIQQGAEDCLFRNELSLALQDRSPYIYIFAHPRTHDDGVNKRLIWQPRLTKPESQTNSYLFRAKSKTDLMEICWLIPDRAMWKQYRKGNVTENELVLWSISQFLHNRKGLEARNPDDLEDALAADIYREVIMNTKAKKLGLILSQ